MTVDLALVGKGLGLRLRELAAALERYDGFAFRPGQGEVVADALDDEQAKAAALTLVLRALRAGCDAVGWRVLSRVAEGDTTTSEIAELLSCPRIVAWEQVNELLQVGLVGRDLDGDRIGITEAGRGVVDVVSQLADAASEAVER